ncbi:MAG: hypothetical protein ACLVJ6_00125 [Merdibacter sp.]
MLSGIYEIEVWALFTQMEGTEEDPRYSGSCVRGRSLWTISPTHMAAGDIAGLRHQNLSRSQIETLIEALKQRVQK